MKIRFAMSLIPIFRSLSELAAAALLPMHTHLIYHIAATQQAPSIIQLADVNGIVVEETTYVST
jgi:hypothetical protein